MIFFGHIGITAGVTRACEICVSLLKSENTQENNLDCEDISATRKRRFDLFHLLIEIRKRLGQIDYRMVIAGSILPDIIDKPIFLIFGDKIILSGRDYAHTLLFNLSLLVIGLILIRYKKSWLLVISLASFMHLILDRIWECPVVLLWPLLGPITGEETAGWVYERWYSIFTIPSVYIPEIIGLVILTAFLYKLIRNKRITKFIISGIID
jgi:inner membrane protein